MCFRSISNGIDWRLQDALFKRLVYYVNAYMRTFWWCVMLCVRYIACL